MKIITLLATFLALASASAFGKIQQQGFKTHADCATAGASDANCLLLTAQVWDTFHSQSLADSIANGSFSGSISTSSLVSNLGISTSESANALTINFTTASGAAPSSGSSITVGVRNSSATTGQYDVDAITAALSIVVPSGATLGQVSAKSESTYVYLQSNSGTLQGCVSSAMLNESSVMTSTAISGSATSRSALYCTSAVTGGIRLVARVQSTQATAGAWASAPTELAVLPFLRSSITSASPVIERVERIYFGGSGGTSTVPATCSSDPCTIYNQSGNFASVVNFISTGIYTVTFTAPFSDVPSCVMSNSNNSFDSTICGNVRSISTTAIQFSCFTSQTLAVSNAAVMMTCQGPK